MSEQPADHVLDDLRNEVRLLMTAMARAGETIATARRRTQERRATMSRVEAERSERRLRASIQDARTVYGQVTREHWWETASPLRIGLAWQYAVGHREVDPQAADAMKIMAEEIKKRYDLDVEEFLEKGDDVTPVKKDTDQEKDEAKAKDADSGQDVEDGKGEPQPSGAVSGAPEQGGPEKKDAPAAALDKDSPSQKVSDLVASDNLIAAGEQADARAGRESTAAEKAKVVADQVHDSSVQDITPAKTSRSRQPSHGRVPGPEKTLGRQR